MNISYQEAIDLLRKWQQQKCILQVGLLDSVGNNAAAYGCIEELNSDSVRIDARSIAKKARNIGLVIALKDAQFSFGDWPSTPPEYQGDYQFRYESFLIVTFKNGSRCELYVTNL